MTNTLRLLQLPPSIQRLVHETAADMGHARALLGTPDRAFQEQLAPQVVQDDLSVRAVEEAVREHDGDLDERRDRRARRAEGVARQRRSARRACSSSRSCSATTSTRG